MAYVYALYVYTTICAYILKSHPLVQRMLDSRLLTGQWNGYWVWIDQLRTQFGSDVFPKTFGWAYSFLFIHILKYNVTLARFIQKAIQQTWKMLDTNHHGNAHWNHDEIPPHACQRDYHQEVNKGWQERGEKGTFALCWRDCKLVQP